MRFQVNSNIGIQQVTLISTYLRGGPIKTIHLKYFQLRFFRTPGQVDIAFKGNFF